MDLERLKEEKQELERHLTSAIIDFEMKTKISVGALEIHRIDTSTLEEKSSLLDSIKVILIL